MNKNNYWPTLTNIYFIGQHSVLLLYNLAMGAMELICLSCRQVDLGEMN